MALFFVMNVINRFQSAGAVTNPSLEEKMKQLMGYVFFVTDEHQNVTSAGKPSLEVIHGLSIKALLVTTV